MLIPVLIDLLINKGFILNKLFNASLIGWRSKGTTQEIIAPLILSKSFKNDEKTISNSLDDLLCGAVGAISKYSFPLVVADLGTATKMYVVDKDGNYIGGIITSGMEVSMKALDQSTSLLLEVPLISPKKIIGKNTKDSIQSGIVYGQAYMISEFARRMEQELGYKLERVLTGGFSKEIKDQVVCFHYEENLVLDGLYKIYHLNERKNLLWKKLKKLKLLLLMQCF